MTSSLTTLYRSQMDPECCISCHASIVTYWCDDVQAVTTSIALELGLGSPLFAVSLAFSLIVMYDAAGVRRHAGDHLPLCDVLHMAYAAVQHDMQCIGQTSQLSCAVYLVYV